MDVLDKIIAFKRNEIGLRKKQISLSALEDSWFFKQQMPSFHDALTRPGPSVIGEFKRKSPSAGLINDKASVLHVARAYEKAGTAAVSVLTDIEFFGGSINDLMNVAGLISIPLLRKDFILDEFQVVESKSFGASAILLIAAALTKKELKNLTELSLNLGMDVLFEIHNERDLGKMSHKVNIVGVNNRNLKTLEVDTELALELFPQLPGNCLKVAESGFQTFPEIRKLYATGYDAFLIGGKFMRSENPGDEAARFINDLKNYPA